MNEIEVCKRCGHHKSCHNIGGNIIEGCALIINDSEICSCKEFREDKEVKNG